ncbi:uncharacterized protein MKK02DRAFT_29904 [Dioszegia hungarica]|uniref:Uncharacterized protein n=1 Tax=Dioszegia hungarica TaxID=4972 RepID=A0AA38H2X7_9TREE|nr:uncharacterized protein MKK02DRAFT_29904 [Dioszegia hungarica]KAI9633115.1 hypothetical protein MKK02DRAFT_29904 [Dioszegia hungarica]
MSYTGPINPFPNAKHLPVSLYGYVPNQGFNVFAAVAWGLVLAAHCWWLYKKGPRGAQSLVVFGCIWELIGYSIRVDTHSEPFCADLFIAQYAMLHPAPVFFVMALVNAIAWGMEGTDDASVYDRFRPRAFAGILQALNIISITLVAVGSTMYAVALARMATPEAVKFDGGAARKVLIAGHALQGDEKSLSSRFLALTFPSDRPSTEQPFMLVLVLAVEPGSDR